MSLPEMIVQLVPGLVPGFLPRALPRIPELVARLGAEDDGATAVEYGLMVALIAVVIIAAVALLGTNLSTHFGQVADCVGAPSSC